MVGFVHAVYTTPVLVERVTDVVGNFAAVAGSFAAESLAASDFAVQNPPGSVQQSVENNQMC